MKSKKDADTHSVVCHPTGSRAHDEEQCLSYCPGAFWVHDLVWLESVSWRCILALGDARRDLGGTAW